MEKLERARKQFLRAAAGIPGEAWMTAPPKAGACSATGVVGHLMAVESAVVAGAQRILKKEPKSIPLLKRFSLPPALVDERLLAAKETMLEQFAETRERTLKLMERKIATPEYIAGSILYWECCMHKGGVRFSREIRHARQIQGIAGSLRKVVAGLQK